MLNDNLSRFNELNLRLYSISVLLGHTKIQNSSDEQISTISNDPDYTTDP